MYDDVAGTPLPDPLRRALGKPWAAHIGVKAGLYGALTRLHQADVFIADDECGEQISCLQVSIRLDCHPRPTVLCVRWPAGVIPANHRRQLLDHTYPSLQVATSYTTHEQAVDCGPSDSRQLPAIITTTAWVVGLPESRADPPTQLFVMSLINALSQGGL